MNDRHLPVKLAVLLIGLMGTAAISSSDLQGVAQTAKPPYGKSPQLDAVAQQLLGTWRGKDPGAPSDPPVTLLFAPDGTLMVSFAKGQETIALRSRYQLNTQTRPMQMSWFLGEKPKASTIFEFIADGRLRFERFEEVTPKKFKVSTLMQKISDATTLKPDVQARQITGQSGEAEARLYLDLLAQAQQAYHLETGKFATSITQLGLDLKSETADYRYQVMPQGDEAQQIKLVGRAKRSGLKSFTGAVFSIPKVAALPEGYVSSLVCETSRASQLAPPMPQYPSFPFKVLQCPSGSQGARSKASKN
ncbi:MAG: type IV pilin-like G/H family protein [Phormidesmis sp. CAN_BIN36]|nr:type IV pilin-like G/H family protein [Phormidesmis sp. CAN_BIN36]